MLSRSTWSRHYSKHWRRRWLLPIYDDLGRIGYGLFPRTPVFPLSTWRRPQAFKQSRTAATSTRQLYPVTFNVMQMVLLTCKNVYKGGWLSLLYTFSQLLVLTLTVNMF